jgi:hypothetical protein
MLQARSALSLIRSGFNQFCFAILFLLFQYLKRVAQKPSSLSMARSKQTEKPDIVSTCIPKPEGEAVITEVGPVDPLLILLVDVPKA